MELEMEFTKAVSNMVDSSPVGSRNLPINLRNVDMPTGTNIFINHDVVIISLDNPDRRMKTDIIRVRDISHVSIRNEHTIQISTPLETFSVATLYSAKHLALALVEVLSPE